MQPLYPLKFTPIYKEKIWGGHKLRLSLNKEYGDLPNCGESWEVSTVKGNVSVVAEGFLKGLDLTEVIARYKESLVGHAVYTSFGNELPLLIKFIDANADLSIQVHPDDVLAKKRHGSLGKTEMWYILQADEGATLINGFSEAVDQKRYQQKLSDNSLQDILNKEKVAADDVFFIPAGRVHTIGKGILLAEIQQSSDVTYRLYDFDRVDSNGNKRELHTEQALEAIDFSVEEEYKTNYSDAKNEVVQVVESTYFTTNKLWFDHSTQRNYSQIESFVVYICIDGELTVRDNRSLVNLRKGECALIPAAIKEIKLETNEGFTLLETYVS